ncbi:patatin-like phospholipase family protein [Marinobacterium rhizophilum]|uniref:Patatin-like phospholipase family protein n=1 Tax=Marinobacterium rhizophilum TaxID=420402 RepID=A0ABY5HLW6_9GAMM|nr:patatin-like phospholipase family protein [Marinobacterium rhizophilum]UTW13285.1 patatin-like phospholipase family protein [Marinobacterium rhizophilum]
MMERKVSVSLALGSGGARGYAHIGVIEELLRRGYHIKAIAGSSMGALVGGMYAAGALESYRDWVKSLKRIDILRLMDVTFSRGAIRGDRVFARLRELAGDPDIESLPLSFTAVATDLSHQKEVWFQKGSLMSAIRASAAVPGFFTPVVTESRVLVDGGVLNPLPIIPTVAAHADIIVAVDLNTSRFRLPVVKMPHNAFLERSGHGDDQPLDVEAGAQDDAAATSGSVKERFGGRLDILLSSVEAMQSSLSEYKIAGYPPDLSITIPKETCSFYEFHRAAEMIEVGRHIARERLAAMEEGRLTLTS